MSLGSGVIPWEVINLHVRYSSEDAADCELRMAAYYLRREEQAACGECIANAAKHAARMIGTVHSYEPSEYPAIGKYYELRDRIVELVQARRAGPTVTA